MGDVNADITGDITSDRDTFVSIDNFNAANNTASSLHPQNNPDPQHTATLDEFLAAEDILHDDLAPDTHNSQSSLPRMTHSNTVSQHDSSFIWAVNNPVDDMHAQQSAHADEDALDDETDHRSPITDDPGDLTHQTLEATSTPSDGSRSRHSNPAHQTPLSSSSHSTRRSTLPSSSSRRSPNSDEVQEVATPSEHGRRGSMPSNALQQSTSAHPHAYSTPATEASYPPSQHHTVDALLMQDSDAENDHDRDNQDDTQHSVHAGSNNTDHATTLADRNEQLAVAAEGYESIEVPNPFFHADQDSSAPSKLVLFSKQGILPLEEKMALQDIATAEGSTKSRVLRRFVETVQFQRHLLTTVKDNEVNLFNSQLNGELRRYSVLERERVFAIDALVDELDKERNTIVDMEKENDELKRKLADAERKNSEVEEYYSKFMDGFHLGDEVMPALERANDGVEKFRRESAQLAEEKDGEIEDYAQRLLKMEDILADSRKRSEQVEAENTELRAQLNFNDAQAGSSDDLEPETPLKRVFISPSREGDKRDLLQTVNEQQFQIDNLRKLNEKADEDRKKVHEAFLTLNVKLESTQSRVATLQTQRNAAEEKCRDLTTNASDEKQRFVALSNEMSKNLVGVVTELDRKEAEVRILRSEMDDRESALQSLKITVKDLEDQLQSFTDTALERSRQKGHEDGQAGPSALVDAVIESMRDELNRAQQLLSDKATELEDIKKAMNEQGEEVITLQKECARLEAAHSVRRRSLIPSPQRSETASEEEARFLHRLSIKLGCHSSNNRELVSQLADRVERLMVQRSEMVDANQGLKREVSDREQALHSLRSEMQAEISSLKAEAAHMENLKNLALDERKNAEERVLQILNEPDMTRRESLADLTVSSVGTRGWLLGDEGDQTRRSSIFDRGAGETVLWNDPVIDAAVESVSKLIGTKDSLAARNRELREKLQNLINSLPADDDEASGSRSVMIQSKELHEELTGLVGLQQGIIEQMMSERNEDQTLPYMRKSSEGPLDADITARALVEGAGEATRFLNDQLAETRKLFAEKLRANAELCGLVDELKEEMGILKASNKNMESALEKLRDTHRGFLHRLSVMTGISPSIVALEDFVRIILTDTMNLRKEMERKEMDEFSLTRRVSSLLVQKRIFIYMISVYQSKYRLNLLASSQAETNSIRRRMRIRFFAVLAMTKIANAAKSLPEDISITDVSKDYDVPDVVDITCPMVESLPLMDASLALSAVPRLEAAIADKEEQIVRLESSLESLNRSAAAMGNESTNNMRNDVPQSAFVYTDDIVNRKKDISRRLQKLINEKEGLDAELSREKQGRLVCEAKNAKLMEKVAAYKRKLGKVMSAAEARESAYKDAIRYLKNKADTAVADNMDENIAPWEAKAKRRAEGVAKAPNAASRAALAETLRQAEADMANLEPGSAGYVDKAKLIEGLKRTIQRLENASASVFTQRVPRPSQDNVTRAALPN